MSHFQEYLDDQLKDKTFKEEWDRLELRHKIVEQLLQLRHNYKLSQKEFAKKVGTTQAVISRIENGNVNVGVDFLNKVAKAFNKHIDLKLV